MAYPFYEQVNRLLEKHGFDQFAESTCAQFYASRMGWLSQAPGIYFRMLLIGYFEGIDSERGIAWRVADSLALSRLEPGTDASRTLDYLAHAAVDRSGNASGSVRLGAGTLGLGRTDEGQDDRGGFDNAGGQCRTAFIVRCDNGQGYHEFLVQLAKESGIATPTREQLARLARKRKKGSNEDWVNPHDPDSRVTKMKDGHTHLAHKAAYAVDL